MSKKLKKQTARLVELLPEKESQAPFENVKINTELSTHLDDDTITVDWIQDNAPWNRLDTENDEEYKWFQWYTQITIDMWVPEESFELSPFREEASLESWLKAYHENHWVERRMAYVKYGEWVARKKDELEQLHHIANFRSTQAELLTSASKAGLALVDTLTTRLQSLEPSEIKAHNIPSFVTALNTFLSMSADAEARLLAVTDLLDYYEVDMAQTDIRQHLFEANNG